MERLTDSKIAAELKRNYEGLQKVGIEPSIDDLRYVRLSELEEENEELRGKLDRIEALVKEYTDK